MRDYAETDLDQIINFSLKYGEETSCEEDLKNRRFNYYEGEKTKESGYYSGPTESEDSTKTYYTEGTPYNTTPYNFSSSNSLTDLRLDPNEEGSERKPEIATESAVGPKRYENRKDYQNRVKRLSREFESGISTPERPVQYCDEGTPGACISRVSSLSSLTSGKEPSSKNSPEKVDKKQEIRECKDEDLESKNRAPEQFVSSEQTPLMFSRSSSMNSLNSFQEVHRDDRSSVVSDLSRMTSGIISPSELPDSPTQTVPPSPKGTNQVCFHRKVEDSAKKSVFDDAVATFKFEDTPVNFTRATSLSSLNADDDCKVC